MTGAEVLVVQGSVRTSGKSRSRGAQVEDNRKDSPAESTRNFVAMRCGGT